VTRTSGQKGAVASPGEGDKGLREGKMVEKVCTVGKGKVAAREVGGDAKTLFQWPKEGLGKRG